MKHSPARARLHAISASSAFCCLILSQPALAREHIQAGWTTPGIVDPVRDWEGGFSSAGNVNWRSADGALVLDYQAVLMGMGGLGEPAAQVECGDVDEDGDCDLVALASGGKILYFENRDSGRSFAAHAAFLAEGRPALCGIRLVDVDGDGDLDIEAVDESGAAMWLENTGSDPWPVCAEAPQSAAIQAVAPAAGDGSRIPVDLDGDGSTEEVFADRDGDRILWSDGSGGGRDSLLLGTGLVAPERPRCADLDSDGDMDICAVSSAVGETAWWENLGNGTAFSCHSAGVLHGSDWCSPGDIDADGSPEIAVCSGSDGSIGYWEPIGYSASGSLVSSILYIGPEQVSGFVEWDAETPAGTAVLMYVRLSDDRTRMGEWHAVPAGRAQLDGYLEDGTVFFQYRIELQTSDFESTPTVTEVRTGFQGGLH